MFIWHTTYTHMKTHTHTHTHTDTHCDFQHRINVQCRLKSIVKLKHSATSDFLHVDIKEIKNSACCVWTFCPLHFGISCFLYSLFTSTTTTWSSLHLAAPSRTEPRWFASPSPVLKLLMDLELQPTRRKRPSPPMIDTQLVSVQETWEEDVFSGSGSQYFCIF